MQENKDGLCGAIRELEDECIITYEFMELAMLHIRKSVTPWGCSAYPLTPEYPEALANEGLLVRKLIYRTSLGDGDLYDYSYDVGSAIADLAAEATELRNKCLGELTNLYYSTAEDNDYWHP